MASVSSSGHRYTPLGQTLDQNSLKHATSGNTPRYILATAVAAVLAFFFGRYSITVAESSLSLNSWDSLNLSANFLSPFRENVTFGLPPSNKSDAAWRSLFPKREGFFRHPELAPQQSAFAVFHQLHCLDGLRRAVWMNRPDTEQVLDEVLGRKRETYQHGSDGDSTGEGGSVAMDMSSSSAASMDGHGRASHEIDMTDPAHVRHCVDMLRQALMCTPDLTVEVSDKELGGVIGFGTARRCIDWERLMAWLKKWEGWGQGH